MRTSLYTPTRPNRFGAAGAGLTAERRWLPSDLAEVFCWMDAAHGSGVLNAAGDAAAHGEKVATWNSRVGVFPFTNATDAQRPTFNDDASGANGRAYLSLDGTDDRLVFSGSFQPGTAGEMFAVVSHGRESVADNALFGLGLSTATTPWMWHVMRADSAGGSLRHQDNAAGTLDSLAQRARARSVHLVNFRSDGTDVSIYKSRVLAAGPAARNWYGDITAHDRATIGGLTRTTFTLPLLGKVYELIFTDAVLDAADRSRMWHYLESKYRIRFWAAIGDSLTKRGAPGEWPNKMAPTLESTSLEAQSFVEHAEGSELTAAALSRWTGDVKGKGYGGVAILSSINDPAGDVPTSTSTANINSIVDEALEEGLKVVLCTPTPFGNYAGWNASRQQLLDDFNAWIRAKAAGDPRIALVEAYDAMGDADPQDLLAAYDSGDGVHWTAAGDQAFADLVESALESFV